MLRKAEERKKGLPAKVAERLDFRLGSMTDFVLDKRFSLIVIPFSGLLELPSSTDRIKTFSRCLDHLAPGGKLVFDTFFRGTGDLLMWGKQRPPNVVTFWGVHSHPTNPDITVHHFEVQEYEPDGAMPLTIFIDAVAQDGSVNRKVIRVRRQYVDPQQCEDELRVAGFQIDRRFGSFRGHAFGDQAVAGFGRFICECSPGRRIAHYSIP